MKPIKLRINAFGSFLNETIIDFNELNKSGFYLITGPTGSGKTTIFDAIMFALYGEASGNVRNVEGLRSDLADDKNPTYVEFTFEKENKQYVITRSPRYSVSFRQTPLEAKVSLQYEGNVIEKSGPVSEAITNIIGLNANQFRQIIMLAQGEFMKLIHAKSTERDEIFRKIFGTEIFEQIELLLKEENKELKNTLKLIENKLNSLLHTLPDHQQFLNYEVAKDDLHNLNFLLEDLLTIINNLDEELTNQKNNLNHANQELLELVKEKQIAEVTNNDFNQLALLEKRITELNKQTQVIDQLRIKIKVLKKVETIKPFYDQLDILTKQYQELVNIVNSSQEKVNEKQEELNFFIDQSNMIELDRLSLINLNKTIEELKNNLQIKQIIQDIEKQELTLNEKNQNLDNQIEQIQIELKQISEEIIQIEDFIKDEGKFIFEYGMTSRKIEETKQKEENLKAIIKENNQYQQLLIETNSANNDYHDIYIKYQHEENKYQEMEFHYFQNIAKTLSKSLKVNTPCPVCGSLNHPAPATFEGIEITKDSLNQQSKVLENLRKTKETALLKVETLKNNLLNLAQSICKTLNIDDINQAYECIEQQTHTIENEKTALNQKYQTYETLLNTVTKQKSRKRTLNEQEDNLTFQLENLKSDLITVIKEQAKLLGEKQSINSKITIDSSIEEINNAIEEREEAILLLDAAIKGFDEEYLKVQKEFAELRGNLDSHQQQQKSLKHQLTIVQKDYQNQLTIQHLEDEIINKIDDYFVELPKLSLYIEDISKYESMMRSLNEQLTALKNKLQDKKRIDETSIDEKISISKQLINQYEANITNQQTVLNHLNNNYLQLQDNYQEYLKTSTRLVDINELTLVANGQNNNYLSFERYVLMEYFDNILRHANSRLSKMTNGRFVLYRKIEKSKGRAQQGLEMEIFDFETGKKRDVTTLSGGETFKAALSLALGLADTIETKAGGIHIDTLFIDEGFGTLDEESLRQAIEILLDLQTNNKSIGIISHVQELKDLIPTKLVVSKDDNGSKIKIIN